MPTNCTTLLSKPVFDVYVAIDLLHAKPNVHSLFYFKIYFADLGVYKTIIYPPKENK